MRRSDEVRNPPRQSAARPRRPSLGGIANAALLAAGAMVCALTFGARPPVAPDEHDPALHGALADYQAGDFPSALREFKAAAERGNRIAEFDYAMMLLNGEGTSPDQDAAIKWLYKAAQANMSHAQYAYGRLFDDGKLVKLDPTRAHVWYLRAAQQGHVQAEVALATQYIDGRGTPRDFARAFVWYQKAARAGDQASQYIVGSYYERGGDGVQQNLELARIWYAQAAAQGGDPAALGKVRELSARLGHTPPASTPPATND